MTCGTPAHLHLIFSNGLSRVFPMTPQIGLILCRSRAVLLSSTYQEEQLRCPGSSLTLSPARGLDLRVCSLSWMPERGSDRSPCSSRVWACVAISPWARNGFAAIFSFFWVLSWFQDTCVSERLSLLVVWSFLGCLHWWWMLPAHRKTQFCPGQALNINRKAYKEHVI